MRVSNSGTGGAGGLARDCGIRLYEDRRGGSFRRELGVLCAEFGPPACEREPQRDPRPAADEQQRERDVQPEPRPHDDPPVIGFGELPARALTMHGAVRGCLLHHVRFPVRAPLPLLSWKVARQDRPGNKASSIWEFASSNMGIGGSQDRQCSPGFGSSNWNRQLSWTGRERSRCLWYRFRPTVAEMNYATRRMVELQTRVP